jgi:hypothetical protein
MKVKADTHTHTHTHTQWHNWWRHCTTSWKVAGMYIPGQQDDSINIQIVYTAIIEDFMRIITTR